MKSLILSIAVIQSLAMMVQAYGCGFMPDHVFEAIMNDPAHSEETKQSANFTLQLTRQLRASRSAYEGFDPTDDDEQYPHEENPGDVATMQRELASYDAAESVPANTSSVEDPAPGPSRRRRDSRKLRRQNNPYSGDRYIHNENMACVQESVGPLARDETSGPSIDDAVNNVYDGFFWVDLLYRIQYRRNSIDNRGERLRGRVHFCKNYANAFWDGEGMLFGDGDGVTSYIGSFAANQDVIGHELTHGVIQRANPLSYFGQTGALNEHLADVFGILSRQYRDNSAARDDSWLLGEDIKKDGSPTRSMRAPGTASASDNQPANMADYYVGLQDLGGVHINSGIPNHAFYLFATYLGNEYAYAWETPGQIWYNVLNQGQGEFSEYAETFASFANKTLAAAEEIHGSGYVTTILTAAWTTVGVL